MRLANTGPGLLEARNLPAKPSGVLLAVAIGIAAGALGAGLSHSLAPGLVALGFLGLLVFPMASAHSRLAGYLLALFVLLGLLTEFTVGQGNEALTHELRMVEFAALAGAALLATLVAHRRRLPIVLVVTPLLLGLVDVAAFARIGFSQSVLIGGLNLYLHFFLLAVFVYYSSISEREMRGLLLIVAAIGLAMACLAVVQFSTGRLYAPFLGVYSIAYRGGFTRAIGAFAWPNELAMFAGAWFFLFYCRAGRSGRALFYSFACVALALCAILSVTRSSILLIVLIVFLLEVKRKHGRARVAVLVAIIALSAVFASSSLGSFMSDAAGYRNGSMPRVYYLTNGLRVWEANPLIGVGFGRYAMEWSERADPGTTSVIQKYGIHGFATLKTTDSFAASILPEFGLIGAIVLLGAFLVLLRTGVRWARVDRSAEGYLGCLLFLILSTFTSANALNGFHTLVLWISIGMLARRLYAPGGVTEPALLGGWVDTVRAPAPSGERPSS